MPLLLQGNRRSCHSRNIGVRTGTLELPGRVRNHTYIISLVMPKAFVCPLKNPLIAAGPPLNQLRLPILQQEPLSGRRHLPSHAVTLTAGYKRHRLSLFTGRLQRLIQMSQPSWNRDTPCEPHEMRLISGRSTDGKT